MVKTTSIALVLTLATVFSSFLANPSIAAENEELASITADRDILRARLTRAIAYSKARGKKLEETEMQLSRAMEERRVLADRLQRAIAVSRERGKKLTASNASRKQTDDRLRRAIAISIERGKKLKASNASRKLTDDRLRRAIAVSIERGKKLKASNASRKQTEDRLRSALAVSKERAKQLAASNAIRKHKDDRLRSALAVSKEQGKKLTNSEAQRSELSSRLRRAIAYSRSTRISLEEQLANSSERAATDWVAQTGASLQSGIGGFDGTEIINDYGEKTVKVQLGNNGLFRRGGSSLSESGKALLSEIAPQLMAQDASFTVIGHTDSIPVGQGGSNEALSFARSISALQFLRDQGIPKDRLSAAGYGADSPIASNDTQEGRQQNRRVEIVLRSN